MTKREIRKLLERYFGSSLRRLDFVRCGKRTIIDIEYEDFLSEQMVEREVRRLVGADFLLNVKRECSETLMHDILNFLASDRNGRKTLRMMMCSFTR